ncbi:MAG TPA: M20/M25/M40 family metallo-hydrolase [Pyrinomonadaceae bacterium]
MMDAISKASSDPVAISAFARHAKELLAPFEKELIDLLQTLVRTNSTAIPPDGCETDAQEVLLSFLNGHGIDAELYELGFLQNSSHPYVRHDRNYSGRHNLIARLKGTGTGRSLMLSGHMDTVPPGRNEWRHSPWSGLIDNGRLYGRGSYDMKGGLVAAFAVPVALKRAGLRLKGDLLCESVVDEEWGGGGGTLAGRLRGDLADGCVIPEPTDQTIFHASRGGYVVDIEVNAGDPENYFSREEVISPAIPMGRLLGWIESWAARRRQIDKGETYRGFADPAPVQVLALEANSFDLEVPLSVPLMSRVRVYFQFLPHEDVASVIAEIRKSFGSFCERDPFFKTYVPEWKAFFDPPLMGHELPVDHEFARCLASSFQNVTGKTPALTGAEYPCDGFLNQNYFGMPTLIFGPRGAGAHNANEYVEVASVLQTAEVLLAMALQWCEISV